MPIKKEKGMKLKNGGWERALRCQRWWPAFGFMIRESEEGLKAQCEGGEVVASLCLIGGTAFVGFIGGSEDGGGDH